MGMFYRLWGYLCELSSLPRLLVNGRKYSLNVSAPSIERIEGRMCRLHKMPQLNCPLSLGREGEREIKYSLEKNALCYTSVPYLMDAVQVSTSPLQQMYHLVLNSVLLFYHAWDDNDTILRKTKLLNQGKQCQKITLNESFIFFSKVKGIMNMYSLNQLFFNEHLFLGFYICCLAESD